MPTSDDLTRSPSATESGSAAPDAEAAIEELLFALYAEDVRLGIVHAADLVDARGALSVTGGSNYRRRAVAILGSLADVSDAEVVQACEVEGAATPRGAAARVELRRRGLTRR